MSEPETKRPNPLRDFRETLLIEMDALLKKSFELAPLERATVLRELAIAQSALQAESTRILEVNIRNGYRG